MTKILSQHFPSYFQRAVLLLVCSFSFTSSSLAQNNPAPWYSVEGVLGSSTGKCTEMSSASAVKNLADMGMANIISEKSTAGKVVEMTFSFQGRGATIYRDKSTCETAAAALLNKQKSSKEKYK
jgi:hypothetical protein